MYISHCSNYCSALPLLPQPGDLPTQRALPQPLRSLARHHQTYPTLLCPAQRLTREVALLWQTRLGSQIQQRPMRGHPPEGADLGARAEGILGLASHRWEV